jgi:hypothetical protein
MCAVSGRPAAIRADFNRLRPQAELGRLKAFASGGGKVLFLGRTPSLISGKTIVDSRPTTPADFSFATVETSAQLPPTLH